MTTIMRSSASTFAIVISAATLALAGPTTVPVIDLTPDNVPSISAAEAVDAVREGTHFVARTGRLTHTTDGQHAIFVFDNDGAATKSPPMLVLPNLNLLLMENVTITKGTVPDFRISGTVTEYKGRNYILIDNAQTTLVAATEPAGKPPVVTVPMETSTPPSQATASKATTVKTNSVSSDQMMNHLLDSPPQSAQPLRNVIATTSSTDASTGKAAIAPDAPVLKIKREGSHLVNRIGRLNHSPDGQQANFTFDTDGKTMQDPPVIIMPNLKLSAMDGAVLGKAMDVHFRISGTVTEYKGRNYILLDKAVAIADVEAQF
jgi:hypothetical protein